MDYQGQKYCESLYQWMLIFFGVLSFVLGVWTDSFQIALYSYIAGFVLTMLVCVPNWPMFNRHPMKWRRVIPTKPTIEEVVTNDESEKDKESNASSLETSIKSSEEDSNDKVEKTESNNARQRKPTENSSIKEEEKNSQSS